VSQFEIGLYRYETKISLSYPHDQGNGLDVGQKSGLYGGFGWITVFLKGWNQVCTHSFYFLIDFSLA
jgi:hypothetical protein